MATQAELAARLDRLPMTKHIWYMVTLISLGGCFEIYDLFLAAYIAPALNKAGYFKPESLGVFNILGPYGVAGIGVLITLSNNWPRRECRVRLRSLRDAFMTCGSRPA